MTTEKLLFVTILIFFFSCRTYTEKEQTSNEYTDIVISDSIEESILYAVTDEENLEFGSKLAYVNMDQDTVIPFGRFAYFGTDTLRFYANVLISPDGISYGRPVGINRKGEVLFDIVMYDNGPDYFSEGLIRVKRNGKMGYANEKGEVVIPCHYDFAKIFENGVAEVTFEAKEFQDLDGHPRVESDAWFEIDREGNPIKAP
jgi:hypothetical protein